MVGPHGWHAALQLLAEQTGSTRAQLIGFGGPQALPFNWVTNFDESDRKLFDEMDGHAPSMNFRVAADQTVSRDVVFEHDYDAVIPGLADDDYRDFCEQTRMPLGCQTMLAQGEAGAVGMALLRSHADGRTDEAVHDIFREASMAARIAVRMQIALEQQGHMLIGGALEAMSAACLLFDRSGRVRLVTPAAEARLAELDRLRVRERRLMADDAILAARLDRAFASLDASPHVQLSLRSASSIGSAMHLDLFRMRRREWSLGFEPCFIGVLRDNAPAMHDHATLAAAFGFTRAESAIAASIAEGRSRQQIASERGVTVETLRGQLKTLYGKTGCRREAELVAMLARTPGRA